MKIMSCGKYSLRGYRVECILQLEPLYWLGAASSVNSVPILRLRILRRLTPTSPPRGSRFTHLRNAASHLPVNLKTRTIDPHIDALQRRQRAAGACALRGSQHISRAGAPIQGATRCVRQPCASVPHVRAHRMRSAACLRGTARAHAFAAVANMQQPTHVRAPVP